MLLFRIITTWLRENPETGGAEKTKTEEIVEAINFTEAEKIAYALAEKEARMLMTDPEIDIKKINTISDILHQPVLEAGHELVEKLVCCHFEEADDNGVGLYSVKVIFNEINEKNGKTKQSSETILVPAKSNAIASKIAKLWYGKGSNNDFFISDVRFDKASAILLTTNTYDRITKDPITI